jgi:hypothetical protein
MRELTKRTRDERKDSHLRQVGEEEQRNKHGYGQDDALEQRGKDWSNERGVWWMS